MHKYDLNRVEFYSIEDMAGGYHLSKGEHILRSKTKLVYEDINDVLELYNIKQYFDNELYLISWQQKEIDDFKEKTIEYGNIVGKFMSKIDDSNIVSFYNQLLHGYINSFWQLVNNQKIYKQISAENFEFILTNNPHEIRIILTHRNIVDHYNTVLRNFLLTYPGSAEILLTIFEVKEDLKNKNVMFLPQSLTTQDKENIVLNYIDNEDCNLNYLRLIRNARNTDKFKLSDKTRLKAQRKEKLKTDQIFEEQKNVTFQRYGVSISFPDNPNKIKEGNVEDSMVHYSYSLNYIKQNKDYYSLFQNFLLLFEFLDTQGRIEFVNKKNTMGVMERVLGIRSQSEYIHGIAFDMNEMSSLAQIVAYSSIINGLGESLEMILHHVFTSIFQEKYNFAVNARLSIPSTNATSFEKVRFIAPEFESVLRQYKLFVDDRGIDSELLQMSSTPSSIKEIPSLNPNKYIYFNEDNIEIVGCSNLFFSDQTLLAYVEPFKEKHHENLFNLLANEEVDFNNYEEYQKPKINYLIDKGYLYLDKNNLIQFTNIPSVLILKDLYENEVASFYHYPKSFQEEAKKMMNQNIVLFKTSLLSIPEQSYFNYYLNKSEFTNGLDLRNKYLHGTQASPEELDKHESAYFTYLKLLVLILLKIEDDLFISQITNKLKE